MRIRTIVPILFGLMLCVFTCTCKTGEKAVQKNPGLYGRGHFRIMFYNVENLFDTDDEQGKDDDEFLPGGSRAWTKKRMHDKLLALYKTIAAAGEWEPPEIIGFCEVENRGVLQELLMDTPLGMFPYTIIHQNSPDSRGIDVALMIRTDKVLVIDSAFHRLVFPPDTVSSTREIIYAKTFILTDTLHIFANHWPSRLGEARAEKNRYLAGQFIRKLCDSILHTDQTAKILVMGDFNDEPGDRSMTEGMETLLEPGHLQGELYNLMTAFFPAKGIGTIKFREQWFVFDQFIVSGNLLGHSPGLFSRYADARIFDAEFLIEPDELYGGKRPFRTYDGYRYRGGFSDHLPVLLDLWYRVPQ